MFDRRMRLLRVAVLGLAFAGLWADRAMPAPVTWQAGQAMAARVAATQQAAATRQNLLTSSSIGAASRLRAGLATPSAAQISSVAAQSTLQATSTTQVAQATAPALNSVLPTTPYYNYLRWRFNLNPARFTHYHPNLGPAFAAEQQTINNQCPCPVPPPVTGPVVIPPPLPQGPLLPPGTPSSRNGGTPTLPVPQAPGLPPSSPSVTGSTTPEPSAVALLLIGLAAAPRLLRKRPVG